MNKDKDGKETLIIHSDSGLGEAAFQAETDQSIQLNKLFEEGEVDPIQKKEQQRQVEAKLRDRDVFLKQLEYKRQVEQPAKMEIFKNLKQKSRNKSQNLPPKLKAD